MKGETTCLYLIAASAGLALLVDHNALWSMFIGKGIFSNDFYSPVANFTKIRIPALEVIVNWLASALLVATSLSLVRNHMAEEPALFKPLVISAMVAGAASLFLLMFQFAVNTAHGSRSAVYIAVCAILCAALGQLVGSEYRSIVGLFFCAHVAAVLTVVANKYSSAKLELHVLKVVCILTIPASLCVIILKQLPGAVDSDATLAQHVDRDRSIHLQFCEPPFTFFLALGGAQGASFLCHLPFVPAAVIATRKVLVYAPTTDKQGSGLKVLPIKDLSMDSVAVLVLQAVMQIWTGKR